MSRVYDFFNHIRLRRERLFETIQEDINLRKNIDFEDLNSIYSLFVNLNYHKRVELKNTVRDKLLRKIKNNKVISENPLKVIRILHILKNCFLDPSLTHSEKEAIY